MKLHEKITHEQLTEKFYYDKETGDFTRISGSLAIKKMKVGNVRPDGYKRICIDYVSYLAHRLAWFYVYKEWPGPVIDHIDGNPSNNAISNLRDTSQTQNTRNLKKPKKGNQSGYLGVSFHKRDNLWRARLKHDSGCFCRYFKTKESAYSAYVEAKLKYHNEDIRQLSE